MKEINEYKNRLPSEKEVKESLKRYFGFAHTRINMLADMDYSKITQLSEKGWYMDFTEEDIEKSINDFVNIYGYIYKEGNGNSARRLMRGTTIQEARSLRAGADVPKLLSTTTDEQIAKRFCEYGRAALMRIKTKDMLPYIYAEQFKDENSANEEEVLILPFAKVIETHLVSNWNGYEYYDITLEKGELPDISDEKIELLKNKCINGYKEFVKELEQYRFLHGDYSKLKNIMPIVEKMNEYRDIMQELLKGLCKQREKDIDLQRQEERETRQQEYRKREQERLEKLTQEVQQIKYEVEQGNVNIQQNTDINVSNFINIINKYKTMSRRLGIGTFNTQDLEQELQSKRMKIKKGLEEQRYYEDADVDIQYNDLLSKASTQEDIKNLLADMPNIEKAYDENSWLDLKKALNVKVQGMIYRLTYDKLANQKKIIASEKDNFISRILGKTALKNARIENIEAKMKHASQKMSIANPSNSVREMLVNMYEYAYEFNAGHLPQEMVDIEQAIREVFGHIPTQDSLMEKVSSSQKSGLPVQARKSLFSWTRNRQETKRLQQETAEMSVKDKNMQLNIKPINHENLINLYGRYNQILEKISQKVVTREKEKRRENTRDMIL